MKYNYTSPFKSDTTIKYSTPERASVSIKMYDILGGLVTTSGDRKEMDSGLDDVTFDGIRLASGMYFYRIKAGDFVETKNSF